MSRSNFRRLKRIELYEIMLAQSKEIDRLRDELAKAKEQQTCTLRMSNK